MGDFNYLHITGVNDLPGYHAAAAFTTKSSEVFKEAEEISPRHVSDKVSYMPWGADDQMPYDIINLIESDETLSTCQMFNAEVCYGSGLVYQTDEMCKQKVVNEVEEFFLDNDMASYFLGACQDFKHFGFAVSVIILNEQGNKVVRVLRKEACYVRFAPANKEGVIPQVLYANWRNSVRAEQVEIIPLLNPQSPWTDLQAQVKKGKRKFAVVSRVPTPDSTYYPIPYYASLFKGKWYNIKQLIGVAKEAKLKNSAPIKYHIEIAKSFWSNIFKAEGITDRVKQQERVNEEKDKIINFLTGMENSGKVLFSEFYVSPNGEEQHDVVINKIETDKEGGNCFANVGCARQSSTEAWATSAPCQYFEQTLYPWLDLPRKLGSTDHSWQRYQELHSKLIAIEERLAHDFFSCELLATLRQAELLGKWGETPSAPHLRH